MMKVVAAKDGILRLGFVNWELGKTIYSRDLDSEWNLVRISENFAIM